MQAAWGHSARALIDRAFALAVERGNRVSTLHLAAAMIEDGGDGAKFLMARGLREQDLRSAGKVHPEEPGTFERVQSLAKRIAASRASETGPVHLLVAALSEPASALACMAAQLGCDPALLADEALRGANRSNRGPIASGNAIIHSGSSRRAAPVTDAAPTPQPSRAARSAVGAPPGKIISNRGPESSGSATRSRGGATRSHGINAPGSKETPTTTEKRQLTIDSAVSNGSAPPSARIIVVGKDTAARSQSASNARSTRPERTEHDLDARTFPAITLLARNLSADSVRGSLDPVVGREREVRRVLDAVARREGRGAIVVGPSGVGKSTLVRAVARENTGRAVLLLRHSDVAAQARGPQGAERARKLVDELLRVSDRILLALDPLAPWFLNRDVPDEVVLELRAALASGKLAWIGTATLEDARRLTEVEPWIERAAMRVELEEPTSAELREMVRAFAPAISAHHGVVAEPTVLERAAELSERYLGGRAQPDRALSVIDLALARARRARLPALSRENVAEVVAELGGLPVDRVAATDGDRLLAIESTLASRVVGHAHAITRVAQTLRRNAVGFRGGRPIGTFLFLGPTGVGKTETAKAIAEALFPGSGAMTRFDMAEFSEPHAVARLVGAPPGYVGHADGGQLTEAVRRRPYQLILLDEIEKAHRDVLESLLALLDEGRMTDGRGRTVDCRNTVIVMTSNLGADLYDRKATVQTRTIGFSPRESDPNEEVAALSEKVRDAARAALPPELWNRIDDPVVFAPLARDEIREIAWRLLNQSFARLEAEQGTRLAASQAVVDLLLENGGFEPSLGARPMRRAIARLVEAPIADAILRGTFRRGDTGTLAVRDWGVEVVVDRSANAATP